MRIQYCERCKNRMTEVEAAWCYIKLLGKAFYCEPCRDTLFGNKMEPEKVGSTAGEKSKSRTVPFKPMELPVSKTSWAKRKLMKLRGHRHARRCLSA